MNITVKIPDSLAGDLTEESTKRGFESVAAWIESWCLDVVKESRVTTQVDIAASAIKAQVDDDILSAKGVIKGVEILK